MSGAALAERPPLFTDPPRKLGSARASRSAESSGGGRLTLEHRLESVWEGLYADGAAECPLCRGRMVKEAGKPFGRCGDCGTSLS